MQPATHATLKVDNSIRFGGIPNKSTQSISKMRLSYEFSNIFGAVYHRGTIKFGPDGSSLYSPIGNKIIRYDLKSNKHDAIPLQLNYNINMLSIHPMGTLMLASSEKSHLYMISLTSGKLLHIKEYKSFPEISHISFSPDGRYYCVCGDNFLLVYVTPGTLLASKGREIVPFRLFKKIKVNHDRITDVSWSPDSKYICAASQDTSLNIFSLTHQHRNVIRGHTDTIVNCYYSGGGQLYCLTKNCHLSVWDESVEDENEDKNGAKDEEADEDNEQSTKRLKKETKIRYHRSAKHYLRLTIDPNDTKETKFKKSNAYITSSDYNPLNKLLVVGYNTGHYAIYEMPSATLIYELDSDSGSISSISINQCGDWIALGSSVDAEVDQQTANNKTQSRLLVWEWQSKSHVLDEVGSGATMSNLHECASYSLDGTHIVSGNMAGRIKVWSAISGETVATFGEEHLGPIKSLKFAPNKSGKVIVSASLDGTIRAYDLNKFKNFRTFKSPVIERKPEFICLDIDSTGEFIAAGTYNYFEIYLYSLQTGKFLEYLTGHEGPVSGVAFSPITNLLVSASWDSSVRIWNLFEGSKCMRDTITLMHEAITVAFRPDGHQFAVSTRDGQISFFNPHTAEQFGAPIEGVGDLGTTQLISEVSRDDKKYFLTLSYSADGTYLIGAGNSNFICIYHVGEKVLVKKIAMTFNMSMDGVFEYVSNRRRNEFGFTMELLNSRKEERGVKPIQLPGVRKGDLGERKAMPIIAVYQIAFSPTMRSFATATTEGVLIYSVDVSLRFDPYKLAMGVDPNTMKQALKDRSFGRAVVEAIQLNDKSLLQEVIESIPVNEMGSIIVNLEIEYVKRILDFIGHTISQTRHIEHYLQFTKMILYQHGTSLKKMPQKDTAATIRALHQGCYKRLMDLKRNCDFSKYSIEYLTKNFKTNSEDQTDGTVNMSD